MKILLLTDYYPPESNAPALRCSYHAEYWVKKGHDVTVLTCAPNFPYGVIYEGYKNKLINSSVVNGVNVVRCWSFISKNDGFILRILDHLSSAIMFSIIPIFLKRPDVVIATSPQFLTLISGYVSSFLIRRPLVSEIRDMWPEGIIFLSSKTIIYKILEGIELFLYRKSSKIITVTSSYAKNIALRTNIPESRISVSYNGCNDYFKKSDTNIFNLRKKLNLEGKFVLGYAGTVGVSHGLDVLVSSFRKIDPSLNAHLLIIGSGAMHSELKRLVQEKKLINVLILDAVPKNEIDHFISLFDICLVSLKDIPAYDKAIPSKLFEAAAHNKPVLAGLRGESKSIIKNYGIGEVFHPENASSFIDKLVLIIHNLKIDNNFYESGLKKVRKDFSRDKQAQVVLDCIKEIK
ncbi:glycosyltransferase family 4 protein [Gammaproteobacteria bacterium]|nr:glycosyltransferase family 4 protein [Gammaproteobacteria bacterium]